MITYCLTFTGPQLIVTLRAQNTIVGDVLRGYSLFLMPPTTGLNLSSAPLVRPQAATLLGEWLAWLTGRYPELADPKMLASGKDNYCEFVMFLYCEWFDCIAWIAEWFSSRNTNTNDHCTRPTVGSNPAWDKHLCWFLVHMIWMFETPRDTDTEFLSAVVKKPIGP